MVNTLRPSKDNETNFVYWVSKKNIVKVIATDKNLCG